MAYYKSEDNTYCDRITVDVDAGGSVSNIYAHSHGPYRLSNISVSFEAEATGDFNVSVNKNGVEIDVASVELDSSKTILVTDISVWMSYKPGNALPSDKGYSMTDYMTITNLTSQPATVIIDFTY